VTGNAYFTNGGGGAFVYSNGSFTFLAPPQGKQVSAYAISRLGQVAGAIYASGSTHAAVYGNGAWTDLGGLSGAATHATGINSGGQIIATAIFPQVSYHPPKPGKHVGLVFIGGSPVDLNTLIPVNSGFTVTDAIAINDMGQILCNAKNAAGDSRAVLLTPN
jgi:chitinase